jgi:MFS family permease
VAEPMIDMRLFQNRLFASTNVVQFIGFAGLTGGLFLLPLVLQSPATLGLGAFESGLATFPQALGVVAMVQVGSRIYPRVGPRRLLMLGLGGVTLTTLAFVTLDTDTSIWWIRGVMFARGCFFSFLLVSLQTATFATISLQKMGRASAASNAMRQVGASFGVALLATVLTSRLTHYGTSLAPDGDTAATFEAFDDAFIVAALITAAGMIAALLVNDKEAAVSMRAQEMAPETAEAVTAGH